MRILMIEDDPSTADSIAATVELSTPPDIATTTRVIPGGLAIPSEFICTISEPTRPQLPRYGTVRALHFPLRAAT